MPAFHQRLSKEDIARLPVYEQLPLDRIQVIRTAEDAARALQTLSVCRYVGFDTESKPVFEKEIVSDGPHVFQFATSERAFIFQANAESTSQHLKTLIESNDLIKVGFGLKSDRAALQRRLGIHLGASIDLAHAIRKLGYRDEVGIRAGVAIALGRRLLKSRKVTTSNWALVELRPEQLQYAANDAHAALAVFLALQSTLGSTSGA
jgi:ribonuclease D